MAGLNLPATQRPHVPTLVGVVIAVVVLLVFYHLAMGKKR